MRTGKKIGKGKHREVYVHPDDKGLVIKKAIYGDRFKNIFRGINPNVLEFFIWHGAVTRGESDIFCPCVDISPCGVYLIMERAGRVNRNHFPYSEDLPGPLTGFFRDVKNSSNWGTLRGRLVLVDYGHPDNLNYFGYSRCTP